MINVYKDTSYPIIGMAYDGNSLLMDWYWLPDDMHNIDVCIYKTEILDDHHTRDRYTITECFETYNEFMLWFSEKYFIHLL